MIITSAMAPLYVINKLVAINVIDETLTVPPWLHSGSLIPALEKLHVPFLQDVETLMRGQLHLGFANRIKQNLVLVITPTLQCLRKYIRLEFAKAVRKFYQHKLRAIKTYRQQIRLSSKQLKAVCGFL